MNNPADDADFRGRVQKLETLLGEIEACADPALRAKVVEAVQTLMEFHGAGIGRMLHYLHEGGDAGNAILNTMAGDDLVSSLLLLYTLHPADVQTRVHQAVDKARTTLAKHNFEVELLAVHDGIARVRIASGGSGCQSTAARMKQTVEEAIYDKAPELSGIEIIGLAPPGGASGFVPLEQLLGHNGHRQTNLGEHHGAGTSAGTGTR